jgi:hypothetical protein
MSSDTPESEMIERLIDGTRQAADRVQDMCRALKFSIPIAPAILIQFRYALRAASGSAHQLGHAQSNPAYFTIRDQLDQIGSNATLATMISGDRGGFVLAMIGTALDRLWRSAEKMATSRAVPRQDVLAALDVRQKALVH